VIALDTNILIYAISPEDGQGRTAAALDLLDRLAAVVPILPLQVVGEYLNVARRNPEIDLAEAVSRIQAIMAVHRCVASTARDFLSAVEVSARHGLQYFDALIITVAARAGATMLLSEDMQDGLEVDGLRVVNPFVAGNDGVIAAYFAAEV
jgi:predicted nucleic acid-binding protein